MPQISEAINDWIKAELFMDFPCDGAMLLEKEIQYVFQRTMVGIRFD
ncbi:MAG: hypothetical protein IJ741_04390 [Schwartzia sp.]|nr:hypothetical protein [Schwartzia sp. (in: firmicutes)]